MAYECVSGCSLSCRMAQTRVFQSGSPTSRQHSTSPTPRQYVLRAKPDKHCSRARYTLLPMTCCAYPRLHPSYPCTRPHTSPVLLPLAQELESRAFQNFVDNINRVYAINSDINIPFWITANR